MNPNETDRPARFAERVRLNHRKPDLSFDVRVGSTSPSNTRSTFRVSVAERKTHYDLV